MPAGDPFREQVALGPIIDAGQRDRIHGLVTASVDAGARLAAGGTYQGLVYRPTVLADVPVSPPAYAEEVVRPAPVVSFSSVDELVKLAVDSEYGWVAPPPTWTPFTETQWVTLRGELPRYPF